MQSRPLQARGDHGEYTPAITGQPPGAASPVSPTEIAPPYYSVLQLRSLGLGPRMPRSMGVSARLGVSVPFKAIDSRGFAAPA